ncbi:MAG: hypothetical protein ACE5G1_01775 [bacterium]
MMRRSVWLVVSTIFFAVVVGYATTVRHYDLLGIVAKSERIFVGKCLSVEERELEFPRGSIWYTEYTFLVSERIKGSVGQTITFRQYGLTKPRRLDDDTILYNHPIGMPIYEVDQEYMLFLLGDSKLGLTGPVGLFQGAFLIYRDDRAKEVAVNPLQNRGLFQGTSEKALAGFGFSANEERVLASKKGPFDLKDFVSVVKKLARAN